MATKPKSKDEKVSPFAWGDALCLKRGDMIEEHGEAAYPAFMVTRAMSQYADCVHMASEINLYKDIPGRYAYDYYYGSVRKAKRFAQWGKKKSVEGEVGLVMSHYQISREKAEEFLKILTPEQIKEISSLENPES